MGCKKQIKKAVFSHFAECNDNDTRQSDYLGTCFAECKDHCTRQTSQICRVPRARHSAKIACLPSVLTEHSANRLPLPSVLPVALGKPAVTVALAVTATFLCRVSDKVHSAKRSLPINCLPSALCRV